MDTMNFGSYSIRLVKIDDLMGYFDLIEKNRKRLEAFFAGTVAVTQNLEATRTHLNEITAKQEEKNHFSFIVLDRITKKMIASIQIKNLDWKIPKAELGYFIDEQYEGKGIITTAVSKIIQFAFEDLQLNKLYIRANHANPASIKVAEKNGFEIEGVLRKDYKTTDGELVDLVYYGLLNPTPR